MRPAQHANLKSGSTRTAEFFAQVDFATSKGVLEARAFTQVAVVKNPLRQGTSTKWHQGVSVSPMVQECAM